MAGVWFTVAFWSLCTSRPNSLTPAPYALKAGCLRADLPPRPSYRNSPRLLSVSFPSGRTDPVPIILKYDVMGMGRMEMEVRCRKIANLLHQWKKNIMLKLCFKCCLFLPCRWTMQRMPQKRGECLRWKRRTQKNCGKNTRWAPLSVMLLSLYVFILYIL